MHARAALAGAALSAKEDLYEGMIIDADGLPADVATFTEQLGQSLEHWWGGRGAGGEGDQ